MQSRFDAPLELRYLDGCSWQLIAPFTYGSVTLERVIEVPGGFETDFASIPKILQNIYSPTGVYGKAAVIHDFLYRTAYYATRQQADAVFFEAMQDLGVSRATCHLLYWGVRVGGGRSYRGYAATRIMTLEEVDWATRRGDTRPR